MHTQIGYAQDFHPLAKTPLCDYAVHAESLLDGNLLVLHSQHKSYWVEDLSLNYEEIVTNLPYLNYTYGRLTLYNQDVEMLKNHTFYSTEDSIFHCDYFDVNERLQEIVVWGTLVTAEKRTHKAFWLDYELNIKKEVVYDITIDFGFDIFDYYFLINSRNNIMFNAKDVSVELDPDGNLVRSSSTYRVLGGFFEEDTINKQYFSVYNSATEITDYNLSPSTRLQLPSIINLPGISTEFLNHQVAMNYDKQYFLLSTYGYCPFGRIERILKYNINKPNYTAEVFYEDTIYGCIDNRVRTGFYGIDMFYNDYIYSTNVVDWCGLIPPEDEDPDACSSSYNTVNCINENGELRWSHLIGGDASYRSCGVVATKDSGCVVIVYRYHPEENTQQESDIYYLKFDKNGNDIPPKSTGIYNLEHKPVIKLYPNPAHHYLHISNPNKQNLNLKLYNLNGRLMLSKTVNYQEVIDIKHLTNGCYAYTLLEENGTQYHSGKLLKW